MNSSAMLMSRRRRWRSSPLLVVAALAALALGAPVAEGAIKLPSKRGAAKPLPDFDHRSGRVAPTGTQQQLVTNMSAKVRWNRFGTPHSLSKPGGFLATGVAGASAEAAARNWLSANKALFRLASLDSLTLDSDAPLKGSTGRAVVFRQSFGGLKAQRDGLLTVGLGGTPSAGWKIAHVTSSVSGDTGLAGAALITPAQAFVAAAFDVGRGISVLDIVDSTADRGWTDFTVRGFVEARARLTALPMPGASAVPAFETLLVHPAAGTTAFRSFVDARTGAVLIRQDIVFHNHVPPPTSFEGETPFGECGPEHLIGEVHASPQIAAIDVVASFIDGTADLVLMLVYDPDGPGGTPSTEIRSMDTGTSPEAIHYEPAGGVPPGFYYAKVCHLAGSTVPQTGVVLVYVGGASFTPVGVNTVFAHPPKWRVFPAYPIPAQTFGYPWNVPDTDTRKLWCWDTKIAEAPPIPGCDEEVKNDASRAPWDFDTKLNKPTYTTMGNNALTAESWFAEILNPGPTQYKPISATRTYDDPGAVNPPEFSNDWFNAQVPVPGEGKGCGQVNTNPEQSFVPGVGYDIGAAVINLFAMHNRMHDWSWHLGFTEETYNAQDDNFGETPPIQENDSLIGNAQEAAATGPTPVLGRTNANMVPLPEGVHPITNMYLWQPFASTIYLPCVDGDFDMAIIGHEYGHLIENRLTAKGGTRFGHEAGSMGEGFGDLAGMEVLLEHGYTPVNGENPFSVGAYVSGNKDRSIRNYPANRNPLNYSDLGYDYTTGEEVHADGEIWVAVNYDIRQALEAKYRSQFSSTASVYKAVQKECANGVRPPNLCPGNRRWMQLLFDAMLLMPANPTMLDARDAMLSADLIRNATTATGWPSNQSQLWLAFARRGMGINAATEEGGQDPAPNPDFSSPLHINTPVTFTATGPDGPDLGTAPDPVNARIYVGDFEARVSPIADTDPTTQGPNKATPADDNDTLPSGHAQNNLDTTARFAPGTYAFIAHAPGYGHLRLTRTFSGSGMTTPMAFNFPTNLASRHAGASPVGLAGVQTCAQNANVCDLIDDTEETAWEGQGNPFGQLPDVEGRRATIDLAGGVRSFNRIQVSAASDTASPFKFGWLRQFEIWTCTTGASLANAACAELAPDVNGATPGYTKRFTSAANAFPGDPPWPVVSQAMIRSFTLPTTISASHVQLKVVTNQCTGQPLFHGEQDGDPANPTDCPTSPVGVLIGGGSWMVTAAELQVFGPGAGTSPTPPAPPADPVVTLTKTAPATAAAGSTITYALNYKNQGPATASGAKITDTLPAQVTFLSASTGCTYASTTRTVTCTLGDVAVNAGGTRTINVRIAASATSGTVIMNTAQFTAALTVSPPTATATTTVT